MGRPQGTLAHILDAQALNHDNRQWDEQEAELERQCLAALDRGNLPRARALLILLRAGDQRENRRNMIIAQVHRKVAGTLEKAA